MVAVVGVGAGNGGGVMVLALCGWVCLPRGGQVGGVTNVISM